MKINVQGTGLTEKRVEAILYSLWALDTPEQIGACQREYDADKKYLMSFVGRTFDLTLEIGPCTETVQSPEGENPRGPKYL